MYNQFFFWDKQKTQKSSVRMNGGRGNKRAANYIERRVWTNSQSSVYYYFFSIQSAERFFLFLLARYDDERQLQFITQIIGSCCWPIRLRLPLFLFVKRATVLYYRVLNGLVRILWLFSYSIARPPPLPQSDIKTSRCNDHNLRTNKINGFI